MEDASYKTLASADPLGTVILSDAYVYRSVPTKSKALVERILQKLPSRLLGRAIPRTEICVDEKIRSKLCPAANDLLLQHERIPVISYPHEWCPSMLKDAAIFHLDLCIELAAEGLYLKDAHPWNILFQSTTPFFIDFTSIVDAEALFAEEYLESNTSRADSPEPERIAHLVAEIHRRMFVPYFFLPSCLYAYGDKDQATTVLEEMVLNASTKGLPSFDAFFPDTETPQDLAEGADAYVLKRELDSAAADLIESGNVMEFFIAYRRTVEVIESRPVPRGYATYYKDKGEDQPYDQASSWNAKQHGVVEELQVEEVRTVLDIGANVGWYTKLAVFLEKEAVAFDVDEQCVELLYQSAKSDRLAVHPLRLPFQNADREKLSIFDGNPVLLSALARFEFDAVLALALVHHLRLGLGIELTQIFDWLRQMTKKRLVLEFVDLKDPLIQAERDFFPAYDADPERFSTYSLQTVKEVATQFFSSVSEKPSTSDSRTLLVCEV